MNESQNIKHRQILKITQFRNAPQISIRPHVSKEIQITIEHKILKEGLISKDTQITNEHQIYKLTVISKGPKISKHS